MVNLRLRDLGSWFREKVHGQNIDKMSRHCSHRNIAGLELISKPQEGDNRILNSLKTANPPEVESPHQARKSLHLV